MPTNTKTPTINLVGSSGRSYTFFIYALGANFKALPGLYVFTKASLRLDGGSNHQILYVGQTGDLSSRFTDHHKQDCVDRRGCTHICVMVETIEKNRLLIEADLVANYNPPCNG
jgi:hypothetical protein